MGDRREDDMSALAWPGFVDILSAVIIMFVFFLLIVSAALYFRIIIYISKVESNIIAEQVASEHEFEFAQVQTEFAESKEQTIQSNQEEKTLTVFFGDDAISVLPEIKEQIKEQMQVYMDDGGADGYTINILSSKTTIGIDIIARKISVARMLNIRNVVLDTGFTSESIIPKMVRGEKIDGSIHWVKIEFVKK